MKQLEFSFVQEIDERYFEELSCMIKDYVRRETKEIIDQLFFEAYTNTNFDVDVKTKLV